ncbi:vacuolar iron transporter homolog 4-like protein, partial [Tanacetum coccineum]
DIDYSHRGQWLCDAVLGATNGLVSVASLMMVYSQLDVEVAQMKRDNIIEKETLPNPSQATVASALAFIVGAILPLLAAAL